MTLEEFLKKQHQDRVRREEATFRELMRGYARLDKALAKIYARFEKELDKERGGAEGRVPASWLHKNKRLKNLQDAVNAEIGKFAQTASAAIAKAQAREIEKQRKASARTLKLLGIKGAKIPLSGIGRGAGRMGDGRRIIDHFSTNLAKLALGRTRSAALNSAAAESGQAAKKLKAAHGILLGRTLTTARTETIRTARDAALAIYRANPDKLRGWAWHTNGSRACAFCRSMAGKRHALADDLVSHPNCRCMPVPDDGKVVERLAGERIDRLYSDIERRGHPVQRHGEALTEQKLDHRCMHGIDPVTGTTQDAYARFPNGAPKPHRCGDHATKFVSKADLVRADEYARSSQRFEDERLLAVSLGKTKFVIRDLTLEEIFGPGYRASVFGRTRVPPKSSGLAATGSVETDLTDGTLFVYYKMDAAGDWHIHTMYPEPK